MGFVIGFLSCLFLVSCAGMSYHYYGISEVNYNQGILLGPSEKEDIPFSRCAPTENEKHPCVIMLTKDFYNLRLDYEDTKTKLKTCEKS